MKSYIYKIILLFVLSINIFSKAIPFACFYRSSPRRPFFNDPRSSTSEWEVMQVLICFRDQITRETAQQYIQYLHKLEPKIYPYIHESGNHPVRGFSCAYAFECYKSPSAITSLESLIKQANECFDPEILTKKRIAAEELEKKRRLIAEQEEERVRKEKERAAEEARRIQQLEEQRKEREELERKERERRDEERKRKQEQARKREEVWRHEEEIRQAKAWESPLWLAVRTKDYEGLKKALLDKNIDVDIVHDGYTPLLYAAKIGDMRAAILLIEKHASITATSPEQRSIMDYALQWLNIIDPQGHTINLDALNLIRKVLAYENPLYSYHFYTYWHTLIEECSLETIKMFLHNDALAINRSIGSQTIVTPLFLAMTSHRKDAFDVIKVLLDAGADPNAYVRYNTGIEKSLFNIAVDGRSTKLIDLFIKYGGTL